jgi:aerobic-type carbon monoxide dehydrogenase small subunit (CoxS/CutS family)
MRVRLNVNREAHEIEAPSSVTLLSALRDDLGLTVMTTECGGGAGAWWSR